MEKLNHIKIMFAGVLLTFFAGYALAASPRVIKTVPENGTQNINPKLRQIRIVFDQDMNQAGYSICGGGPLYPKTIGKPKWINNQTIVMKVKLEPNHEYKLSVNCPSYKNFRNAAGEPAIIYPITFKTGSAKRTTSKSASLLLQEALYAEETEGDLEKAIEIYQQVIDEASEIQRLAAKATYRLGMCYLKKGDKTKAAEYFQQVISNYSTQRILVKKANEQLKKIKPETKKSVFEQIDGQVIKFIGDKYGQTAEEAETQNLYCNSHIYYVDPNFFLYRGGLTYYYNWTGRTISEKVRLSGTSYPNQTLYDTTGNKLNTEIVPDKTRPSHWQIYWIPEEPLAPGEALYYGWSVDDTRKLSQMPGEVYSFRMQNQFGSPVIETFFLVLPKKLGISQSNPPTRSQELLNFNVYWWTKTVQQGENHVEKIQLEKAKSPIDLSTPEATIKSFVKAVYDGNLEAARACVSKDGHDYDEFMEMLATESNHPFQAMIKAMDTSIPVEITSKDITEDRCKIKWYFTLGRVYYFGETKMKKGTHQKFDSYLELVGDKWLIRDI